MKCKDWLKELKYQLKQLKYRLFSFWTVALIVAVVQVLLVEPCMWVLNRLPIRRYMCWLLKHEYKAICFKSGNPDVYVSVADTEEGCVFCGKSSPNTFPMVAENIDFRRTKHRTVPPKHNVLAMSKSD